MCLENTIGQMWKAFFANCVGKVAKKMSCAVRIKLLARAVLPILRCRWSRWAFTLSRADTLNGLQNRMVGIILDVRVLPGEAAADYARRRAGFTASVVRFTGRWGQLWARAVVSWAEHLERPRNAETWAAKLANVRSPDELAARRSLWGRPATRVGSGWIKRRWWDGVPIAKELTMK